MMTSLQFSPLALSKIPAYRIYSNLFILCVLRFGTKYDYLTVNQVNNIQTFYLIWHTFEEDWWQCPKGLIFHRPYKPVDIT